MPSRRSGLSSLSDGSSSMAEVQRHGPSAAERDVRYSTTAGGQGQRESSGSIPCNSTPI